jgi:quinolinate synthase
MSEDQLADAIRARKAELGSRVIILGHHYQQDSVVQHADFTGDSFKLSQLAAQKVREVGSKYVIFCGVHFMAESADVLAPQGTTVILPDLSAGCSMADMAAHEDVVDAWDEIHAVLRRSDEATQRASDEGSHDRAAASPSVAPSLRRSVARFRVIPITYMNSTAAIKAFVGEHGGAVCTSSNAEAVLKWAFAGGTKPLQPGEQIKIMFFPDQHLGRNTAAALGYDIHTQMCLWDPRSHEGLGGIDEDALVRSDVILWKGHCSVHKLFRPEHIDELKARDPNMTVMVHPECIHEVVEKADLIGSTEGIIKAIEKAPAGSKWAIGTEVHLVNRLAKAAAKRGVFVRILSDCQCLCTTMFRIDQQHLLWVLDELAAGRVVNPIHVDDKVKHWAQVALQRMLDITSVSHDAPVVTPGPAVAVD